LEHGPDCDTDWHQEQLHLLWSVQVSQVHAFASCCAQALLLRSSPSHNIKPWQHGSSLQAGHEKAMGGWLPANVMHVFTLVACLLSCAAHAGARHSTVVVCWSGPTRLPLATTLTTSPKQSCSTSSVEMYQGTVYGAVGSTAGDSCTSSMCCALWLVTVCAHILAQAMWSGQASRKRAQPYANSLPLALMVSHVHWGVAWNCLRQAQHSSAIPTYTAFWILLAGCRAV
jgi:hypothetical protein